ncbi:MAG: LacI family transcriptional regulator, partial [Mesorhizobium sp.]
MPRRSSQNQERRNGSARMRDVAVRAGVSTMTVSRVLNEPGKVSEEMRE